jgi:Mg2+ and Co2+ transporter CorA
MNFDVMPELQLKYGYYAWRVLMWVVAMSLLVIFRIQR